MVKKKESHFKLFDCVYIDVHSISNALVLSVFVTYDFCIIFLQNSNVKSALTVDQLIEHIKV